jgi:hypothetical protein
MQSLADLWPLRFGAGIVIEAKECNPIIQRQGATEPRSLLFLAGMLSMPLIFTAALYRILRERFVLWHSSLTISLLLPTLTQSGLAVVLVDPPAMTLSWMTTLILGLTIASGAGDVSYPFIPAESMMARVICF